MANERQVVLYIAQSLDGYIAKGDDDISWLSMVERQGEDYGYSELMETVDTVFMGRRTYEVVQGFGIPFPHRGRKCFVLSRSYSGSDENVTYLSGNLAKTIGELKALPGANILLDGGSATINAFQEANLIDVYIISIIPVLLGSGIPLFRPFETESALTLVESKSFDSGLVQLKYIKKTQD